MNPQMNTDNQRLSNLKSQILFIRVHLCASVVAFLSASRRHKKSLVLLSGLILPAALLALRYERVPRAWAVNEVPITFWAWQLESPSEADVQEAISEAGARALFLRAGQLDCERNELRRIRALRGKFSHNIKLHLVYNATRSLLTRFERIDTDELATVILRAFEEDKSRADKDKAQVVGLQLDFDMPTRLLGRYTHLLNALRRNLPRAVELSITGLPTWMDSRALDETLAEVGFWIPQFYGASIPDSLDAPSPIASVQSVAREVERARGLGRPFYAGLAAYGYAILYGRDGRLTGLRGDLDPNLVVRNPNLILIERRPFEIQKDADQGLLSGEWRYLYRARSDFVIDGLTVRAGEHLLLDAPTSQSMRDTARIVRNRAGDLLLGLCIFRLPCRDDRTTLTIKEVSGALSDTDSRFSTNLHADIESSRENSGQHRLTLRIANAGSSRSLMGVGAINLDLPLPRGSLRAVSLRGFDTFEPLCADSNAQTLQPCSLRRANLLRLSSTTWVPGEVAYAAIEIAEEPPETLAVTISAETDDGRTMNDRQTVTLVRRQGQ
jgi:uncharacterized protein DUF3142